MNKVPVWRTVGEAYSFAFANLATIIGLIWFPLAILLAGEFFVIRNYMSAMIEALASGNRFAVYNAAGYLYLFWIAALFLQAVIAVPVIRQALGLRSKGAFVHFALGPAEFRMFGAYVAYDLIVVTLVLAAIMVWAILLASLSTWAAGAGKGLGLSPALIGLWARYVLQASAIVLYVALYVRLWLCVMPVVVAEKRIGLIRSWTLSRGNFLRMLLVVACVTVPAWLLYVAVQLGLMGFAWFGDILSVMPAATRLGGSAEAAATQMNLLLSWLPYFFGAWYLVQPLGLGLIAGAAAAAYRALVPEATAVSTPSAEIPAALA